MVPRYVEFRDALPTHVLRQDLQAGAVLRCAASSASFRWAGRPAPLEGDLRRMLGTIRHRGTGPVRGLPRRPHRPGQRPAQHPGPEHGPAAPLQRGRLPLDRLQRRDLQPRRDPAGAGGEGPPLRHPVRYRDRRPMPTRSSAPRASSASTASSPSPSGTPGSERCSWAGTGWASARCSTRNRPGPSSSARRSRPSWRRPGSRRNWIRWPSTRVFTYWSPLSPRTAFAGDPGASSRATSCWWRDGRIRLERYWALSFPAPGRGPCPELRELCRGVPQPAHRCDPAEAEGRCACGSLPDAEASIPPPSPPSSGTTPATAWTPSPSPSAIPVSTRASTSSGWPATLGTSHQVVYATHADIGRVFPDVVWHTEAPIMRTSPAPMFLLSKLVRDHRFKVVLTGEGADEFLAGVRPLQGGQGQALLGRQSGLRAEAGAVQEDLPLDLGARERKCVLPGRLLRDGPGRDRPPGLLPPAPVADHRAGQALLLPGPRAAPPGAGDPRARVPGGLPGLGPPAPGPVPGDRHLPLPVPALVPERPGGHGPTPWKGGSPSWTTASSSSATTCRRR